MLFSIINNNATVRSLCRGLRKLRTSLARDAPVASGGWLARARLIDSLLGWQWVSEIRNPMSFSSLGYEFGSTFRPVGLLMSTKSYPLGLWARVCFYNTRTREPMDFLNLIQHRAIVILFREFITNLTSIFPQFIF